MSNRPCPLPSQPPAGTSSAQWLAFEAAREALRNWFITQALPLWHTQGVDRVQGGFFEKLDAHGRPVAEPRRTRVVARQLYVFSVAPALGWQTDTQDVVNHGLAFLRDRLLRPDGTYASAVTPLGEVVNPAFDLYEQAFALFAMATVHRQAADWREPMHRASDELLTSLRAGWQHPLGGFEEGRPRVLPLRANPHMHLFEAALQWAESLQQAGAPEGDAATWWSLADELAELALHRLIDADSGLLTEFFDGDWRPQAGDAGRCVEPGHQFEWGWLLLRWGRQRGHPRAIEAARHMVELAEARGTDPARGVAVNAMDTACRWTDAAAKLWPQTERVKAWTLMSALAPTPEQAEEALQRATQAINGLMRYLGHPLPGGWQEVLRADDRWQDEPVRASSLYHIVCALETACALQAPQS